VHLVQILQNVRRREVVRNVSKYLVIWDVLAAMVLKFLKKKFHYYFVFRQN